MTVIHLDEVVETLKENDIPTTRKKVAQKHISSINNMSAGTVILNFGGGYGRAVKELKIYPGRKIYCAGIDHWNVSVPEGCIGIGSIYDKLDEIAPLSQERWQKAKGIPVGDADDVVLPNGVAQMHVFVRDPTLLPNARDLASAGNKNITVYDQSYGQEGPLEIDLVGKNFERNRPSACYIFEGCRDHTAWYRAWAWSTDKADGYDEGFIRYFFLDPRPDCDPKLYAFTQDHYFADYWDIFDYDEYYDENGVHLIERYIAEDECWKGLHYVVDGQVELPSTVEMTSWWFKNHPRPR